MAAGAEAWMSGWGSRRRRSAAVASGVAIGLTLILLAPDLAPGAGAVIANPGNVRVDVAIAVHTPTLELAGTTTGSGATATVRDDGTVEIPPRSLTFQPIVVKGLPAPPSAPQPTTTTAPATTTTTAATKTTGPGTTAPTTTTTAAPAPATSPHAAAATRDATVRLVFTTPLRGALDPQSGAAFLTGQLEELWSQPGGMSDCPVGPFSIVVQTDRPGADAYTSRTGSVTMVDTNPSIAAVAPSTGGCAGTQNVVNAAQSLPVTSTTTTTLPKHGTRAGSPVVQPPADTVVVTMTLTPAPRARAPKRRVRRTHPTVAPTMAAPPVFAAPAPPAAVGLAGSMRHARTHRHAHVRHRRVRHHHRHHRARHHGLRPSTLGRIRAALLARGRAAHGKTTVKKPAKHARRRGFSLPGARPARAHARRARPAHRAILRVPKARKRTVSLAASTLHKHGSSAWSTLAKLLGVVALLLSLAAGLALVLGDVSGYTFSPRRRRLRADSSAEV